jgi:hypothetical protein
MTDPALRWGLPAGFRPVLFPISPDVKDLLREMLGASEPAVVTLSNVEGSIFLVATPQRLFTVRSGQGAGITGFNVKEFPWEGLTDLRLQSAGVSSKIALHYKSNDGRTVEIGRRAALAKAASDNLTPFDPSQAAPAFEAIQTIWAHKRNSE